MDWLINRWHDMMGMPKYDIEWHNTDMQDELLEYQEAKGFLDTWSELSDVTYTYTRALWSGHISIVFPLSKTKYIFGILYMFPKYSLRWCFFRRLGKCFSPTVVISEVRNPRKLHKLDAIAEKYNLDPSLFVTEAKKLMKWWIFL